MQFKYAKFVLTSSNYLVALLIIFYGGAVIAINSLSWAWWIKGVLWLIILLNFFKHMPLYGWLSHANSIQEFWFKQQDSWGLKSNSGEVIETKINYPIFIGRYLVILNFKSQGKKLTLLVSSDSLLTKDFKRLKLVLKINQ